MTPSGRPRIGCSWPARSSARGRPPFEAVPVKDGKIVTEFGNREMTTRDVTKPTRAG